MKKVTILPFVVLGILLFILIAVTAAIEFRQEIRKEAAEGEYVSILELSAIGQGGNTFTIAPGELFQIELKLIPNQALSAVDVVLDFDRDLLTLENILTNRDSNLQTFVPLDEAGNFQRETIITEANNEGVIRFGAVTFDYAEEQTTDPQSSPVDPLATLTFRAQVTAQGTATIEFGTYGFTAEGATTDSNAVKYVASSSSTAVVDILARPTTRIQATIAEAPPPAATFHLTTGWNQIRGPGSLAENISNLPAECSAIVGRENSWFRVPAGNYGGLYYLRCLQPTTWTLSQEN